MGKPFLSTFRVFETGFAFVRLTYAGLQHEILDYVSSVVIVLIVHEVKFYFCGCLMSPKQSQCTSLLWPVNTYSRFINSTILSRLVNRWW